MAGKDVGPSIYEVPARACTACVRACVMHARKHARSAREGGGRSTSTAQAQVPWVCVHACPRHKARRHRQNLELMAGGAVEQVDALLQGALEAAAVDGERPTHGRRAGGLGQRG
jgi:hypothetical protein